MLKFTKSVMLKFTKSVSYIPDREIIKSNQKVKIAVTDIVTGWIDAACGPADNVAAIKEDSEPNNEAA